MRDGKHFKAKLNRNKGKFIILFLVLIISISMIIINLRNKNIIKNDEAYENISNDNSQVAINTSDSIPTERMTKLKKKKKGNSDIIGWLEIEGTNVNYPVLQGKDNDYYMTHNYKKEYSKEGSLFLDKDYDWKIPSTNLLIYGHNNRGTNKMFSALINYKDEHF